MKDISIPKPVAIPIEENIPNDPNVIKITGNTSLLILKIVFLSNINFDDLYAINALSIIGFKAERTTNNIKAAIYNMLLLRNNSFGENILSPIKNIIEIKIANIILRVFIEFIISFLYEDLGKKRIIPTFIPKVLILVNRLTNDMVAVASPTCSTLYNLATIIQKKKPKKDITAVLAIR